MANDIVVISKQARKDFLKLPGYIGRKLIKWQQMVKLVGLERTMKIPGYHDEPLKGGRKGQRSIRLSRGYRAIDVINKETQKVRIIRIIEINKHRY